LGQVCHRGLGVLRFRVSAQTAGGHAWGNMGEPSAIHELASVISSLTTLPLPRKPRTSLNVGVIQGGTSVNTIASSACFEIDLRSEDHTTLTRLANRVKRVVKSRVRPGVSMKVKSIGSRPAGGIRPSHPLVKLTLDTLAELNVRANLDIGSTDANSALSKGFPAVCLGVSYGGNPHTINEYIEIDPVQIGLEQFLQLLHRAHVLPGMNNTGS
jgi:tripeptide aminopeptidase